MGISFRVENGDIVVDSGLDPSEIGVTDGATFVVVEVAGDLKLMTQEDARQFQIAMQVMDDEREVLAALAESERMDRAKAIMDRYAGALEELAK